MSNYHGWTHVPKDQGGTDPIPGLYNRPWIAANGVVDSDGDINPAADTVYTEVFVDQEANTGAFFDYTTNTAGGSGGADAYGLRIRRSGLYTFSFMLQTSDLVAGTTYDLITSLQLASTSNPYPNWFNTGIAAGYMSWQRSVRADAAGQISLLDSVTVPIRKVDSPPAIASTGRIGIGNTPADAASWTVRIWIAYLGAITWSETDFTNPTAP